MEAWCEGADRCSTGFGLEGGSGGGKGGVGLGGAAEEMPRFLQKVDSECPCVGLAHGCVDCGRELLRVSPCVRRHDVVGEGLQ